MRESAEKTLQEALTGWSWPAGSIAAERYGEGHINDTFCVTVAAAAGQKRYILQRINTDTFTDPDGLMENICGVTEHLRKKILAAGGDPAREAMHVVPTRDGKPYYTDSLGGAWRLYDFVEGSLCLQSAETEADFYQSAVAFGEMQRQLSDYPAETLHESIPNFHDTVKRYEKFEQAVAADSLGRAARAQAEIAFVRARKEQCAVLLNLQKAGKLPLRVTHNDTKLNNVLFDSQTRKAMCIIDLDTIMPGLAANDYGDSIRFGANNCAEDEQDLSKVQFSLPLFESYTKGFLSTAGQALTDLEKETLPWGAWLMTLECGIRFLTDWLEGDHYFRIHRPDHNLDRARVQFKLVQDMEAHWDELQAIVRKYC